jgi:hypothetical protein
MSRMDTDIFEQVKNNPNINAIQYFSLKMRYFDWLIKHKN